MNRLIRFTPLIILLLFVAAVAWRLANPADEKRASALIGHPVPSFELPPVAVGKPGLSTSDLATGAPRLLNVFASWCVPCIAEAPVLDRMKSSGIAIDAIAIRDRPEDIADFLDRNGDPFQRIGNDADGRVQLLLGSAGVPETFVIDGRGVIRYQHIGPIEPGDVSTLVGEMEKAR